VCGGIAEILCCSAKSCSVGGQPASGIIKEQPAVARVSPELAGAAMREKVKNQEKKVIEIDFIRF
jgi:hypothetical protein